MKRGRRQTRRPSRRRSTEAASLRFFGHQVVPDKTRYNRKREKKVDSE